jgi:NADP-dependent 3-hydroxy acid dehydrogenase YdfG
VDIQSDDSIATYLTEAYGHTDVLINNAGVLLEHAKLPMRQLHDTTFSTNLAGTACLTEVLVASTSQPRGATTRHFLVVSHGLVD